ncbi:MAG: hypothetical protein OEV01_08930 [Nitrospira sp.]|nr:hypothetical protein [Nitrospira sp.]MDH4304172.1 hypothetical protein [Nitrospira sp.]MDH5192497.1 hypothetical protein [Nitrospira sp.]
MEPTRQFESPRTSSQPLQPERLIGEDGREIQPWEITLGKTIFYLTIAAGLWFF